ncbi:aldehyde oxidase GLOX-like [Impatiens glandulifera]|uniref:aldehyde oxidase GLOX-like n=1 Tax=Impatiens glandulifera TaxID=253017 RepID=UPI001FB0BC12|nr:aldehyde oxidase GLOX-like [Impatiens glandulifera]
MPYHHHTRGHGSGGMWVLLLENVGISAMHMQVLHDDKVIMFDRKDFGPSNISLPVGTCNSEDCTAHSILYDIRKNTIRPLTIRTDTWCSSGAVIPDGTLIQTGGYRKGEKKIRTFKPCGRDVNCDWIELPASLESARWYASNHILPDGRIIIIGGAFSPNYEFYPKDKNSVEAYDLPFLSETTDDWKAEMNNLYPFVNLLPDGNLFMFANNRSVVFDYVHNKIILEFPQMPGGVKRNYPSTGSSVMLPLDLSGGNMKPDVEVMVCGGAVQGSFDFAMNRVFRPASNTCGRLRVTDPNPVWQMEEMPVRWVMPDMLLLPTGDVILINGAQNGTAGWDYGEVPNMNPFLYIPWESNPTRRFVILKETIIPRMYHSTAALLPDGSILIGGSNPHFRYEFAGVRYPTELRLQKFMPTYLSPRYANLSPTIKSVEPAGKISYGQKLWITFSAKRIRRNYKGVTVTMVYPSFTTHSYAMNQRVLLLDIVEFRLGADDDGSHHAVSVVAPGSPNIAPPGYYMLFVVNDGIPGHSTWINIS